MLERRRGTVERFGKEKETRKKKGIRKKEMWRKKREEEGSMAEGLRNGEREKRGHENEKRKKSE